MLIKTQRLDRPTVRETGNHPSRWILILLSTLLLNACITTKPRSRRPTDAATVIPGIAVRVWGDNTCGSGALATVLNLHGDPSSEAELDARLPKGAHGGVVSVDLLLETRRRGFEASLRRGDEATVRSELAAGRPVILMLRILDAPGRRQDLFHYIIVDGHDPQRNTYRTQFGDGDVRWVTLDRIKQAWEGGGNALLAITGPKTGSSVEVRLAEAVALEEKGETARAITEYQSIVEENPSSVRAWTNLGNAFRDASNPKAAEEAYRRALALDSEDSDALNNLAWHLMVRGGDLEEAESLARKAVGNSQSDHDLYLDTLGRILLARGNCDEAEITLTQAMTYIPPSRIQTTPALLAAIGYAQQKCGHRERSLSTFEKARAAGPDAALREEIEAALARSRTSGN